MISGGAGDSSNSAATTTTSSTTGAGLSSSGSTIGSGDRKRSRPAAQQEPQSTNDWNPNKDVQEKDSKKAKYGRRGDDDRRRSSTISSSSSSSSKNAHQYYGAAVLSAAAKRLLRPAPFLDHDVMIRPRNDDINKMCSYNFQKRNPNTKNPGSEHPSHVTTTSEQDDYRHDHHLLLQHNDDDDDTRPYKDACKFPLSAQQHNDYNAKDDICMDHEIDDCQGGGEGAECTTVLQASSSSSSSSSLSHLKVIIMMFAMFVFNVAMTISLLDYFLTPSTTIAHSELRGPPRHHPHVIPPSQTLYYATNHWKKKSFWTNAASSYHQSLLPRDQLSNVTLRQFLSHPDGFHLGIAPAFFGFYVYFGTLTALSEHVLTESDKREGGKILLPIVPDGSHCRMKQTPCMDYCLPDDSNAVTPTLTTRTEPPLLKSVAGASAGAMAAVLLAAGLNPRDSADFASGLSVDKFWDFPGLGGILKGQLFEEIMVQRLKESRTKMEECGDFDDDHDNVVRAKSNNGTTAASATTTTTTLQLEHGLIPVAATAFDVFNLHNIVLTKGCMGKAARASATFPVLFQPCAWMVDSSSKEEEEIRSNDLSASATGVKPSKYRYLIDGGLWDTYGLEGLGHLRLGEKKKRIVNMVAGSYGIQGPRGPSKLTMIDGAEQVVSISIENTPRCGPWAMKNGPRAVEAAMNAVISVLDVPMYQVDEEGHYVIHVDASAFVPKQPST